MEKKTQLVARVSVFHRTHDEPVFLYKYEEEFENKDEASRWIKEKIQLHTRGGFNRLIFKALICVVVEELEISNETDLENFTGQ